MGEVYLAENERVNRQVAVKVLSGARGNPELLDRFRNEARIHQRLFHPNVAAVFEFVEGTTATPPCLVMEYVDGPPLMEWVNLLPTDAWQEKLAVVAGAIRAIGYLHTHNVIHRDIKPDNIRLTRERQPKLLDFGIARDSRTPKMTAADNIIGTLQYMAPELLEGNQADARSDVWSLGVLLYEVLTGRLPFVADDLSGLLSQVRKGRYTPPTRLDARVSPICDDIVGLCLQHEPRRRPDDAGVLAMHIDEVLAAGGIESVSQSLRRAMKAKKAGSSRLAWGLGAGAAIASLGVLGFVLFGSNPHDGKDDDAITPTIIPSKPSISVMPATETAVDAKTEAKLPVNVEKNEVTQPANSVDLRFDGFGGVYDVYVDGRLLGKTGEAHLLAPFGSTFNVECRKGLTVIDSYRYEVGMKPSVVCGK